MGCEVGGGAVVERWQESCNKDSEENISQKILTSYSFSNLDNPMCVYMWEREKNVFQVVRSSLLTNPLAILFLKQCVKAYMRILFLC